MPEGVFGWISEVVGPALERPTATLFRERDEENVHHHQFGSCDGGAGKWLLHERGRFHHCI